MFLDQPVDPPNNSLRVAPSLLAADFAKLGDEIRAVERAGADWIHVDVMDGHFVPNLTMGPPVLKSLRSVTRLPLDVHLMIENPERYLEAFAKAGADYLTVHIEAVADARTTLAKVRDLGARPGLTLKPGTPIEAVLPFLDAVDLVLVMTVEPGFGGQSFMRDQVRKIERLREERGRAGTQFLIEVDGGINGATAREVSDADVLVAGNFIFQNDYASAIAELKSSRL